MLQPSVKKARYVLVDASGTTVKSGTLSGGKHQNFSLLTGTYHYRSYVKGVATPFEDVSFTVTATQEDPGSHFYSDSLAPDLGFGDVAHEVPQNC